MVTDWLAVPPGPVQLNVNTVLAVSAGVWKVPLVGSLPVQPSFAVQLVAFVVDQVNVTVPPETTLDALGARLTVGAGAITSA